MFKICSFKEGTHEPFSYMPVTNAEDYILGQVMKRNGDLLTSADDATTGVQEYIMACAGKGDGVTRVACHRITRNQDWEIDADNVAATPVVGSIYELNTAEDGISNTTTNGVFRVNKVFSDGGVRGNFETAYDR